MNKVRVILILGAVLSSFFLYAEEENITANVDFSRPAGPMKAVHGVNNAPIRLRNPDTAKVWEYEEAGIPYMRTHDTYGAWGGTHYVDVPNVFPDFDADETDPKNYDFAFTDAYLKSVVAAGTKIYYRLGVTIETNWRVKAYNIHPPKDFAKWARICEHIVRHYNEGWANGFKWGIEYWEIWNEPENPPMWTGSREQFFELYRVAANHLKRCFPDIKVGGYGSCGFYAVDDKRLKTNAFQMSFISWFEEFCRYVTDEKTSAPLDFFSWHQYVQVSPRRIITHADYVRKTLDSFGLKNTESHFNEWNYVGPEWDDFESMLKARGAACISEAFCLMQKSPSLDKAMYYDARPNSGYGGLFRLRGKEKRTVTYFAFKLWNEVYKLGTAVESSSAAQDFGIVAAKSPDGRKAVFLANNSAKTRRVALKLAGAEGEMMDVRLLDDSHSSEEVAYTAAPGTVVLKPYMVAVVETPGIYTKPAVRKAGPKIFAGQDEAGVQARKNKKKVFGGDPYAYKELTVTSSRPAEIRPGLFDFGKDGIGWLELNGEPAGEYVLVLGEMTNAEGRVANLFPESTIRAYRVEGRMTEAGHRVCVPKDRLNTTGWDPAAPPVRMPERFPVVTAFRYVEIISSGRPFRAGDLVRKMVHYPIDMDQSSFECDNAVLNGIYEFCRYSILATSFCGYYVDGDRERTQYEGDAYINQLCQYAMDADYSLARKSHERLMEYPTWPTEWKQHSIKMAWADWMWTGDSRSLAKYYEKLQRKLRGCYPRRDIVDWPKCERDGFDMRESNAVVEAFHVRNLAEMSAIAAALGKKNDAEGYARRFEEEKAVFLRDFYNPKTGLFVDAKGSSHSSLHANAAAVAFDLVPPEKVARIIEFLEGKGMACSVYFAQYLLEAFCNAGRADIAVKLMSSPGERGWKAMMDFGSTVTMEAWSVKVKPNLDLNHAWGAVPLNIISRFILGVTPLEPGFARISVRPALGGLARVKGTVPTAKGPVEIDATAAKLRISVPAPARVVWNGKTVEVPPGEHVF